MKTKTAIVGCGLISHKKFIPILKKLHNRATLVGLCDLNQSTLENTARAFGISQTYSDLGAMLAQARPDVVIVATPPAAHEAVVVQALAAGCHVLVEKPMALSVDQCQRMIAEAARTGRKLGVMHNQAYNPAVEAAYRRIQNGDIGTFVSARIMLASTIHDMTTVPDHWAHKLPAGIISETGPHAVYLSLMFIGKPQGVSVRVCKHLADYPWSLGDNIAIDLVGSKGSSSIILEYASDRTLAEFDLIGTKGMLRADLQTRTLVDLGCPTRNEFISADLLAKSAFKRVWQTAIGCTSNMIRHRLFRTLDGHYVGVKRFLEHVQGSGDGYIATGEDGMAVIEVMEEIVRQVHRTRAAGAVSNGPVAANR